ncbi:MAG: glycine cleavage system protein H [Bdellovibrio sp.]
MGYLWFSKEDGVYTIGLNDEGLEQLDEVESIELPREGEDIEEDVVCGSIEAADGHLDLYSPVAGNVVEINSALIEDVSLLQEDPSEAWLFKVESDEEIEDEDEEDEDDDDDDEDENSDENED